MIRKTTTFAAAVLGAVAASASANTIVLNDSYGVGTGGEFKVTTFTGMPVQPSGPDVRPADSLFQTFCIEKNEYISLNGEYNWDLNTEAVAGGVAGGTPDPLDPRTAYLYTQFYHGVLNDYDYTGAGRNGDADELQEAIWSIEQEIGTADGKAAVWIAEAVTAVDGSWGHTIGNVRVLNLWSSNSPRVEHQDVLVLVPSPSSALAGVSLLAGLGVAGYVRRRHNDEPI